MTVWILSFALVFNGQWWIEKDYREFSSEQECKEFFLEKVRNLASFGYLDIFHIECRLETYI